MSGARWLAAVGLSVDAPRVSTAHRTGVLDAPARAAVEACVRPRQPDDLFRDGHDPARVAALLTEGWLVDLPVLAARQPPPPPDGAILAIPSRGRADRLGGLLRTLAARGEAVPVRVSLDGTDAEIAASRAACAAVRGLDIAVSTPASRRAFAARVAEAAGVPDAVIAHGTACAADAGPHREGGGRNSLVLEAGERAILWLDDDLLPEGTRRDGPAAWTERAHAYDTRPLRDVDVAAIDTVDLDPTAVLTPLGASPLALVPPTDSLWPALSPAAVRTLASPAPASVTLVAGGLLGDEGSTGNVHRLFLPGDMAGQLAAAPASWRWWRTGRTALRDTPGLRLTALPHWMTAWASLDPRGVLPPFPVAGRGSDTVFSHLLARVRPETVQAIIPHAMRHDPGPRTVAANGVYEDVVDRPLATWLLSLTLHEAPDPARSPEGRLRRMAHRVLAATDGSPEDTARRLLDYQVRSDLQHLATLRTLRTHGPDVAAWHADVDRGIGLLEAALRTPRPRPPSDIPGGSAQDARTWQRVGTTLGHWARLALVWSRVRAATATVPSAFDAP